MGTAGIHLINEVFVDFANAFVGASEDVGEIVHTEQLDRGRLDYSLVSLEAVDGYLSYLHYNPPERLSPAWSRTVLWGGAYVGEVIRRNAAGPYEWVDFDDFIAAYPQSMSMLGEEKDLPGCAVLSSGDGGFTLPINKVVKSIADGPADSVAFYASAECRDWKLPNLPGFGA